jgi:hypothetical protein
MAGLIRELSMTANREGATNQSPVRDTLDLSRRINVAEPQEAKELWTGGPVEELLVKGGVVFPESADPTELGID